MVKNNACSYRTVNFDTFINNLLKTRFTNEEVNLKLESVFGDTSVDKAEILRNRIRLKLTIESGIVDTTIGKIIFNNPIPQDLGFIDRSIPENRFKFEVDFLVGKSGLKKIIDKCIKIHGPVRTSVVLDHIKAQGYKYSTKGAITVAVCDAVIPPQKKAIIAEAEKEVDVIRDEFMMGLRSNEERYEEVLRIWEKATNDVTDALQKNLDRYNPIFMMADSGARGSMSQIRQLAGMRGLIANTSGKTIEIPINTYFHCKYAYLRQKARMLESIDRRNRLPAFV